MSDEESSERATIDRASNEPSLKKAESSGSRPRRRRYIARWSVVLPLMALTWALMFYLIYRAIQSGRL